MALEVASDPDIRVAPSFVLLASTYRGARVRMKSREFRCSYYVVRHLRTQHGHATASPATGRRAATSRLPVACGNGTPVTAATITLYKTLTTHRTGPRSHDGDRRRQATTNSPHRHRPQPPYLRGALRRRQHLRPRAESEISVTYVTIPPRTATASTTTVRRARRRHHGTLTADGNPGRRGTRHALQNGRC